MLLSSKRNYRYGLSLVTILLLAGVWLTACGETPTPAASTTSATATTAAVGASSAPAGPATTPTNGYKVGANVTLSGAGASYPDKVYQKWIANFATLNSSVKLSYKSVGSGAGRKSFFAGEVDFAGTDAYPSKTEMDTYGKPIITIPTTVGGVVVA